MLLENLTYSQINRLVDDACIQAVELNSNLDEKDFIVTTIDQLNNGQLKLKNLLTEICIPSETVTQFIFELKLIRSILVDMLFCLLKTKEVYKKQPPLKLNRKSTMKKVSIGINGMSTEYICHDTVLKLHALMVNVEKSDSFDELPKFIADWLSSKKNLANKYTHIDTQLFYADIIYNSFTQIYSDIFSTNDGLSINPDILPSVNLYTWVGGDQDGVPFTTAAQTQQILNAFAERIREHYRRDLSNILLKYDNPNFRKVKQLLETTDKPEDITVILDVYDYYLFPEVYIFNLKLKTFGFHYIELEFRENSRMIHEAIDQIIDRNVIYNTLFLNKTYKELNERERELLLTKLISKEESPQKIINNFYLTNADYFSANTKKYLNKTVFELHEIDHAYLLRFNARRFLEWFFVIKNNPMASNKFGIAEAKSITDALAVLFCAKAILGKQEIHIVIQPEGPAGAEALYTSISTLYENNVYMTHLRNNKNVQYLTFGPSDIGKQGGKGMHLSNMQLANMHRIIAKKYNIELITSIVIGHEHSRCNNILIENLSEFGVNQGSEIRYMLAGLNEMRHHIFTPTMTQSFFKTIYNFQCLSSSEEKKSLEVYQKRFNFWMKSVRAYESVFFKDAYLPTFLKEVARLDVIKYVTKDSRPQSRKYWLERAEIDPSQIRAVAWTRSLLLSGFHFEWLGAEVWSEYSIEYLNYKFNQNVAFNNYIKNIAYSCARTNIKITWSALGYAMPLSSAELVCVEQSEVIDSRKFLAKIHASYLKSLQLVNKAVYRTDLSEAELFAADRFALLEFWPDLAEEVRIREQCLEDYYSIIVDRNQQDTWLLNPALLNNIYSTFINESNTAVSFYLTANANSNAFLKAG